MIWQLFSNNKVLDWHNKVVDYEVWRLIGSEQLGGFAPVYVSDQAIYNRIERAATPLHTSVSQRGETLVCYDTHGWF